jgi:hypothetical protein
MLAAHVSSSSTIGSGMAGHVLPMAYIAAREIVGRMVATGTVRAERPEPDPIEESPGSTGQIAR